MGDKVINDVERSCVFCCGSSWFAVPALSIREVVERPVIVGVPNSSCALVGLSHIHNEFVPVLSLQALLSTDSQKTDQGKQLILMSALAGPWALLVDCVESLESLELSINTDSPGHDSWSAAVLGSANCRGKIVRVIEPKALYRLAAAVVSEASSREEKMSPLGPRQTVNLCGDPS